jgi:hypothetical protein
MIETLGDAATKFLTTAKKYPIVIPGTDQLMYLDYEEKKKIKTHLDEFKTVTNNFVKNLKTDGAIKYISENISMPEFIKKEILSFDDTSNSNILQQIQKT